MILLDTNILSELMRPTPEAAVEQWLAVQPDASVFISAITAAELRFGAKLMPPGKRQTALVAEIEGMIGTTLAGASYRSTARQRLPSLRLPLSDAKPADRSPRPTLRLLLLRVRAVRRLLRVTCRISRDAGSRLSIHGPNRKTTGAIKAPVQSVMLVILGTSNRTQPLYLGLQWQLLNPLMQILAS
jgi:predicted nucleic acid-binding protein